MRRRHDHITGIPRIELLACEGTLLIKVSWLPLHIYRPEIRGGTVARGGALLKRLHHQVHTTIKVLRGSCSLTSWPEESCGAVHILGEHPFTSLCVSSSDTSDSGTGAENRLRAFVRGEFWEGWIVFELAVFSPEGGDGLS